MLLTNFVRVCEVKGETSVCSPACMSRRSLSVNCRLKVTDAYEPAPNELENFEYRKSVRKAKLGNSGSPGTTGKARNRQSRRRGSPGKRGKIGSRGRTSPPM